MRYTIVILLNATPLWLSKSRAERDEFVNVELGPVLNHFSASCKVSLFDSDFTHAKVSDFMLVETDELETYGLMMGYLRESATLAAPYFVIQELVVGVANNFRGSMEIADLRKG